MTAPLDLDALSAALAKATPEPWSAEPSCDENEGVYWSEDLNAPVWMIATPYTADTATWLVDHIREADAVAIATLHNAAPQMIAEITALREERGRLREVLVNLVDALDHGIMAEPENFVASMDAARAALNPEGAAS